MKNPWNKIAGATLALVASAQVAMAQTTTVEDLFAGIDVTGLEDEIVAFLLVVISMSTVFFAYKWVRKILR